MGFTGAGFESAGVSYAGVAVPSSITASPIGVPLPDYYTGQMRTGRLLNPLTGDVTFTSDGRVCGESTAPQLVKLALITAYNSAIVDLGIDLSRIQMKGSNFVQRVTVSVSQAVQHLVAQRVIKIVNISVYDLPRDAALGVLTWTDLTTQITYNTPIKQ